ncbi:Plectin-related isoform 1 [Hibiscus syriacus]|uniref:Plectin-related isoform 1 n=1 Tax=Hibiscus syriacus TaxID=106335 RepID=A0A6A3CE94_HIBSY|nr:Plectin-related isoform 1 [Hibiscus syriacus]
MGRYTPRVTQSVYSAVQGACYTPRDAKSAYSAVQGARFTATAEKGEGPVLLLLHGFPELWYSWRHQIVALSSMGYQAVAPDLRSFGDSDAPDPVEIITCLEASYYVTKFQKGGFTGGLNYYRNLYRNWELLAPWVGCEVKTAAKFVVGDKDLAYNMPGMKD